MATNALGQPIGAPLAGWSVRPHPTAVILEGGHGRVVPLTLEHEAGLFEAFGDDVDGRTWTYLAYGPFSDRHSYREHLRGLLARADTLFFAIEDNEGRPQGIVSYLRVAPEVGSIEVGHVHYAPRLQRTALATEVMFLMMAHVFDDLGYRRYEWKCDALNAASRRAAERLGFCFEGIFRQAAVYKGRNRDTAWYAITDDAWPPLRAGFRAWLSPDNFDAHGGQRQSLSSLRARM